MRSKEWFGNGPYRVWANRLRGVTLARWDTDYNDQIPGMTWDCPEFKGWFSRWEWMAFTTTEGRFAFLNDGNQPYVGVYSPRDGKNNPVLNIPRFGLGVYQVITGFGTKIGNGCTSGHGICGLARLSTRSFVAVGVFFVVAILTVTLTGVV